MLVVRELVESYVEEKDIGPYIDDLWARISGKLERRGSGQRDVAAAVKTARAHSDK